MPIVRIELIQGRAPKVKNELIARVTDAVATTLGVDPNMCACYYMSCRLSIGL